MTTQAASDEVSDDPGSRGSVEIKDRAISRTAIAAALKDPRVTRTTGGLSRLTGRELPRADVTLGADTIAVNLYIGVRWPSQITEVTQAVHAAVEEALATMTGLHVHRVNVLVSDTTLDRSDRAPTTDVASQTVSPRPPTAGPAAMPVALLFGFLLLGVAFVAGREFLIAHGTIGGSPWIADAIGWVARLHWQSWMIAAAIGAAVVGSLLVFVGVKPRTRTHSGLGGGTPTVWATPTDIARLCSAAAQSTRGVTDAHTVVTRKKIELRVERDPAFDVDSVDAAVREALAPVLSVTSDGRRSTVKHSVAPPTRVS
ncbi:Asp23/Gls24 family envelope stress response protein [Rhodococcoides yunnanense]|uniref:Asp23/Gls24 family envelope stress response protein n=1 Tax=Rhodococcoides yunnanense TaxID=278209 RepID=A0ABU4BL15_9NOCA|nr:Asp23/Gls24 family envelope stress response protein [Rhodococcus yunnanensis]MDV6264899.1 Asp23/Gls24 family envelope stress response protein [Rhodococcus yunnanensis]